MTQYQDLLASTRAELEQAYERFGELADWAEEEMDARAITHKLQEAMGPLRSAIEACAQYEVGVLPEPTPHSPLQFVCIVCNAAVDHACDEARDNASQRDVVLHRGVAVHRPRRNMAADADSRRKREAFDAAEALVNL